MLFGGKATFDNLFWHLHLSTSSKPFRIQTMVIWVRGALVKQNKDISLILSIHSPRWSAWPHTLFKKCYSARYCFFNVLLLLLMLSHSVMSDSLWFMDYSLPRSYVHGILQAEILEWVAISYSGGLPNAGIKLASLCLLQWQVGSLPPSHLGSRI